MSMFLPSPHEFESRAKFSTRFLSHSSVLRNYPTLIKRTIALNTRWAKARNESLVSIKTSETEMLLFGKLT